MYLACCTVLVLPHDLQRCPAEASNLFKSHHHASLSAQTRPPSHEEIPWHGVLAGALARAHGSSNTSRSSCSTACCSVSELIFPPNTNFFLKTFASRRVIVPGHTAPCSPTPTTPHECSSVHHASANSTASRGNNTGGANKGKVSSDRRAASAHTLVLGTDEHART